MPSRLESVLYGMPGGADDEGPAVADEPEERSAEWARWFPAALADESQSVEPSPLLTASADRPRFEPLLRCGDASDTNAVPISFRCCFLGHGAFAAPSREDRCDELFEVVYHERVEGGPILREIDAGGGEQSADVRVAHGSAERGRGFIIVSLIHVLVDGLEDSARGAIQCLARGIL